MNNAATLSFVACLLGAVACGSSGDKVFVGVPELPPAADAGNSVPPKRDSGRPASCVEGAQQSCSHDLGTHGGVHSCAPASQVCSDGAWGACDGPVLVVDGGEVSFL